MDLVELGRNVIHWVVSGRVSRAGKRPPRADELPPSHFIRRHPPEPAVPAVPPEEVYQDSGFKFGPVLPRDRRRHADGVESVQNPRLVSVSELDPANTWLFRDRRRKGHRD